MRNQPWQAHALSELLILMNWVLIAAGICIGNQHCPIHRVFDRADDRPDLDAFVGSPAHASPRTTSIDQALATGADPESRKSVRMVTKSLPAIDLIASIVDLQESTSPATVGR
ncbi:hypothetical protein GALL_437970 [mine drainage metagenome]|uniref:Uncharacterized protein n=1 Tax=mine drainage metagenome TaxID=410659 RepID=A0A1J5PSS9_9ZZZZ